MIGDLESSWTRVEDKLFEEALVQYFQEDDAGAGDGEFDGSPDWRWRRIADAVPGKSPEDCRAHYEALVHDVNQIDLGRVELPSYPDESSSWWAGSDSGRSSQISFASSGSGKGKHSDVERKKGTPWTEEEHK